MDATQTPSGVLQHEPGRLSRWGVVDVGLKCVHSCSHCFYSFLNGEEDQFAGMRRAGWHSLENLLVLVDSLEEHDFLGFDITGGEPTAHAGLVDIVQTDRQHVTEFDRPINNRALRHRKPLTVAESSV